MSEDKCSGEISVSPQVSEDKYSGEIFVSSPVSDEENGRTSDGEVQAVNDVATVMKDGPKENADTDDDAISDDGMLTQLWKDLNDKKGEAHQRGDKVATGKKDGSKENAGADVDATSDEEMLKQLWEDLNEKEGE